MKEALLALIEKLESQNDFEGEFYLTYTGQLNDGDISDWAENHFDDNVELGFSTGQTCMAADIITELKLIIEKESV